jgi:hypothetical protein
VRRLVTRLLHPADVITFGIVAVVVVTLAVAVLRGVPLGGQLGMHVLLLTGYGLVAYRVSLVQRPETAAVIRGISVVGVMFFLYGSLGTLAFEAIPWNADPWLADADRLLFRGPPALWIDRHTPPGAVEPLSFFYAAFIPYLYLSILLGLIGRPPAERSTFVTAFALLYALSFLGYLFLPAKGPIVEMADAFAGPLEGGPFHRLVVAMIDGMGGPHGAFPSLHIGASLLACTFDLRLGDRLRGLIYVPLVALIGTATLVLRYHYVVDLLAGMAFALIALLLAPRLMAGSHGTSPGAQRSAVVT